MTYDKKKYTWMQRFQIKQATKANLDITYYLDSELEWSQMEQMRLAQSAGFDVSLFKKNMNANEMEVMRFALINGKDVSVSNIDEDLDLHPVNMSESEELQEIQELDSVAISEEELVKEEMLGTVPSDYPDVENPLVDNPLVETILDSLLVIDEATNLQSANMSESEELKEIQELDPVAISEEELVKEEMLGRVPNDYPVVENPQLDEPQQEYLTNVENSDKINLQKVAIIATKVEDIQIEMVEPSTLNIEKKENKVKVSRKVIPNLKLIIVTGIIFLVLITGIVLYPTFSNYTQSLVLQLKSDTVDLEINKPFIAGDFLDKYSQKANVHLILPQLETDQLGTYSVVYEVTNGSRSTTKNLVVNIVDLKEPIINLTEESIDINKTKGTFDCMSYVENAVDDVDGDITSLIKCSNALDISKTQQNVEYLVTDKSGNVGVSNLIVNFKIDSNALKKTTGTTPKVTPPQPTAWIDPQPQTAGWAEVYEESWTSGGSYEVDSDVSVGFE